jgi:hypothetical protein
MRRFRCACGNHLYFHNSRCLQCGGEVGFEPESDQMVRLERGGKYVRCSNGSHYGACNWVTPRSGTERCRACVLNRLVPNLSTARNLSYWAEMELAKRRVLVTLAHLGLRPQSRAAQHSGVAFDFLEPTGGAPVLTGHLNGIITMNIREADPIYREHMRQTFGEPQRSLAGHFRHEFGHYYWDRFFGSPGSSSQALAGCREIFGDEREDYLHSLKRHYRNGPPSDWRRLHLTAYASAHPWEDWAETWAIYLCIVEGVETAHAFGWRPETSHIECTPPVLSADMNADGEFMKLLHAWSILAPAMNEIEASLGLAMRHSWFLPPTVLRKLYFVHTTIGRKNAVVELLAA